MKKLVLALILTTLCFGCTDVDKNAVVSEQGRTNTVFESNKPFGGNFSDEHYVWENFEFSTNRVNEIK